MSFGIENRLSKIFKPESGKTVMLAVDHGIFKDRLLVWKISGKP